MRLWFDDDDAERARRGWRARRSASVAVVTTRRGARRARRSPARSPSCCCGTRDAGISRLGVLGLWALHEPRDRPTRCCASRSAGATYLSRASMANVLLTVALTVTLVVGPRRRRARLPRWATTRRRRRAARALGDRGAHGIGLDRRAAPARPAAALRRAHRAGRRRGLRAQRVDRAYLLRAESAAAAGLFALAVKLATLVIVAVRGFPGSRGRRWPTRRRRRRGAPPLRARSPRAYVVVTGLVVAGLTLLGRWVVRLLAAPDVLRRARGAAVGRAGLGALRALPRARHRRRAARR